MLVLTTGHLLFYCTANQFLSLVHQVACIIASRASVLTDELCSRTGIWWSSQFCVCVGGNIYIILNVEILHHRVHWQIVLSAQNSTPTCQEIRTSKYVSHEIYNSSKHALDVCLFQGQTQFCVYAIWKQL